MDDAHVSEADAFTLQLERDPLLRSTIVAVALFDRPPDWKQLGERVERATHLAPAFRSKLVPSPLRLAPPRWVPDPDFDLGWHLRRQRVPEGGDVADVLAAARNMGMAAFDRERALWEFVLMEDLPDGGAALVMKVHHALTDGLGGVALAAHVVDLTREPGDVPLVEPVEPPAPPGALEPLLEALGHDVRQAVDIGTGLVRRAPRLALDAARDPLGTMSGLASTALSVGRFVMPVTRTSSPVMRDRRLLWRYDTLDVPATDLKAAGAAAGGTLNDAFLTAVTGGLRRYHDEHGATPHQLRLTMPISIRGEDDGLGGNRVTLARIPVPLVPAEPAERMRRIARVGRASRQERANAHSNLIAAAFNLLPVGVTGQMVKHLDLVASNVPGLPTHVYVGGGRVEAFYAFGPTLGTSANVTLMSYAGTCNIGVNTDAGAIPDPERLMACLRQGFDEVLALAPAS